MSLSISKFAFDISHYSGHTDDQSSSAKADSQALFTSFVTPSGTVSYTTLTAREEEDVRRFLDELDRLPTKQDVAAMSENLHDQLTAVEDHNIHSVMSSRDELLQLVDNLDEAGNCAGDFQKQLSIYHQFIADVEDSMSTFQDRDQLVQTTVDNRKRLLDYLADLLNRLTLDPDSERALTDDQLIDSPAKIAACTKAAVKLDKLLNCKVAPGESELLAVEESMQKLKALRDAFAVRLSQRLNDLLFQAAMHVNLVTSSLKSSTASPSLANLASPSAASASVDSHAAFDRALRMLDQQRSQLHPLSALIGSWLQVNRPDVYDAFKRTYCEKLSPSFAAIVQYLFADTRDQIQALVRPSKGSVIRINESIHSETGGSSFAINETERRIVMCIPGIVDKLLTAVLSVINQESEFVQKLFNLPESIPEKERSRSNPLPTVFDCMRLLFKNVESATNGLVSSCEHLQPVSVMALLVVGLRHLDREDARQQAANSDSLQRNAQSAKRQSTGSQDAAVPTSFSQFYLHYYLGFVRKAFHRYTQSLITMFRESKPSRKSRAGLHRMTLAYISFCQMARSIFTTAPPPSTPAEIGPGSVVDSTTLSRQSTSPFLMADQLWAHECLLPSLMQHIDRVANDSDRTPREVVLLENYHALDDTLRRVKIKELDKYRQQAKKRYNQALEELTRNSMGRPLEHLTTFFDNVQRALDAGVPPETIQYQFAFSKQELAKVIKTYPIKEIKHVLENLCRKVDKHLSDESQLFVIIWHSIQTEFLHQTNRFNNLIQSCYPGLGLQLGFTVNDLQNFFAKIVPARFSRV